MFAFIQTNTERYDRVEVISESEDVLLVLHRNKTAIVNKKDITRAYYYQR